MISTIALLALLVLSFALLVVRESFYKKKLIETFSSPAETSPSQSQPSADYLGRISELIGKTFTVSTDNSRLVTFIDDDGFPHPYMMPTVVADVMDIFYNKKDYSIPYHRHSIENFLKVNAITLDNSNRFGKMEQLIRENHITPLSREFLGFPKDFVQDKIEASQVAMSATDRETDTNEFVSVLTRQALHVVIFLDDYDVTVLKVSPELHAEYSKYYSSNRIPSREEFDRFIARFTRHIESLPASERTYAELLTEDITDTWTPTPLG